MIKYTDKSKQRKERFMLTYGSGDIGKGRKAQHGGRNRKLKEGTGSGVKL